MRNQEIPDAFQGVTQLGPAKQAFRVGRWAAAERIASAAGIVLILLLMLGTATVYLFAGRDRASAAAGSLATIGVVLLAAYFLWKPFRRAARTLRAAAVLYEGGIAVSFGGDPPRALAWDDIRQVTAQIVQHSVWGLIPTGREYRLTVSNGGPEPVELDSPLGGIEQIYQAIQANAAPRISAEALARFREGGTVEFGPIRVDRMEGIRWKKGTLAWNAIRDIVFKNRTLCIYPSTGGLFGILMFEDGSIPNIDALLAVCREAGIEPKT
jgi:hypothetical protein